MKPVGVVVALPGEARCLGDCDPVALRVVVAGVGATRARQAAERLVEAGVGALVSWGWAGALDSALKAGDVVLPGRIIDGEGGEFRTENNWRERLVARAHATVSVSEGALVQVAAPLTSPQAKRQCARQSGTVAVDMESASVAAVAARARLPFMAVRAIVDSVRLALPEAAIAAIDDGGLRPSRLFAALLRRPGELPALVRLALARRAAGVSLRRVRVLAGARLAAFD